MVETQKKMEIAHYNGLTHWIDSDTYNRGWYTCLLTGQKFRGAQAHDMLMDQDEALTKYYAEQGIGKDTQGYEQEVQSMEEAQDCEQEIKNDIENNGQEVEEEVEETKSTKRPAGVPVMVEIEGEVKTAQTTETLIVHRMSNGDKNVKTTLINCVDCGAPRLIKVQDVFQVKRCPHCQAEHRKAMRRANYKAKKEAEKLAKEVERVNELQQLADKVGLTSEQHHEEHHHEEHHDHNRGEQGQLF